MYQIETFTLCNGWTNTWHEDDKTLVFKTEYAAIGELNDFLKDAEDAYLNGDLDSPYNACEYRVTKIGV